MKEETVKTVGAFQAKTNFSKLLQEVEQGKTFRITLRGRPVAELRRFDPKRVEPKPGLFRGRISMTPDFDEPLDDFAEYM